MKKLLIITVLLTILLFATGAGATTISLEFDSLPSAQGWTPSFSSWVTEAENMSADGTTLTMNTMGEGFNTGAYYHIDDDGGDIINSYQPYSLSMTARIVRSEETYGNMKSGFEMIGYVNDLVASISLDISSTDFHTYRIEADPGAAGFDFFIDNVLIDSGISYWSSPYHHPNYLAFGDTCPNKNFEAEITSVEFSQGAPVPLPTTILLLGSGLVGFVGFRMNFRKK